VTKLTVIEVSRYIENITWYDNQPLQPDEPQGQGRAV